MSSEMASSTGRGSQPAGKQQGRQLEQKTPRGRSPTGFGDLHYTQEEFSIRLASTPDCHMEATGVTLSRNPSSFRDRTGCWSLRIAFASTCRTRSRVTLKILPTSSSV